VVLVRRHCVDSVRLVTTSREVWRLEKLFTTLNPIIILGGLIAVAIGCVDLWFFKQFSHDTDLLFLVGGLASMGVHFLNGSAGAVVTAVKDLKNQVASSEPAVPLKNAPPK
jgi:hypothetical protein